MAWLILTLVFIDELLLVAAASVWGTHVGGWPLAIAAGILVVALWWAFASPKARYGGTVVRPLVKVVILVAASAGLASADHEGAALALLVFSILINALAQLSPVLALQRRLEADANPTVG